MRRRLADRAFTLAIVSSAILVLGILATIAGSVLARGAGAVTFTFLTEQIRSVGAEGGVFYHIAGTLILVATAAAVAVPLSTGLALTSEVYVSGGRRRQILEGTLHALNAIPSIVFGLAGLAFFVVLLGWKKSWLAGGIVLGIMIVPTVTVALVEKLRAIPRATIEAARGLGLPLPALVTTVLLPQAASGLVTGTLLGLARAAGETAPIMFTAVIFAGATIPHGIADSPVLALPYHIFVMSQDSYDPRVASKVWGTAVVLLGLVSLAAIAALPYRMRIHEEARHA